MPSAVTLVVLAFVAIRATQLVIKDSIAADLRRRLSGLTDGQAEDWQTLFEADDRNGVDPWARTWNLATGGSQKGPPFTRWQWHLGTLLRCPWCAGFWLSLAIGLVWAWQTTSSSYSAGLVVGIALSGIVGVVDRLST